MADDKNGASRSIATSEIDFPAALRQRKLRFYRDHDRLPTAEESKRLVVEVWKVVCGEGGVS